MGALLGGITIRVYRGGELKLGEWDGMFLGGLLATIISIIYLIPYCVISTLLDYGPMANFAYVFAALIIELVVLLITFMAMYMGLIRFAKEQRFGATFQMKELFAIIGWLRYLANMIVIGIVVLIIVSILLLILVVGWIHLVAIMPLLFI